MRIKFFYIAALAAAVSGCDIGASGLDAEDPFHCSLVFNIELANLKKQNNAGKAIIARATALKQQSEQRIAQLDESPAIIGKKAQAAFETLQESNQMTLEEQTEFYETCAKQYPDAPATVDSKSGFVK